MIFDKKLEFFLSIDMQINLFKMPLNQHTESDFLLKFVYHSLFKTNPPPPSLFLEYMISCQW